MTDLNTETVESVIYQLIKENKLWISHQTLPTGEGYWAASTPPHNRENTKTDASLDIAVLRVLNKHIESMRRTH